MLSALILEEVFTIHHVRTSDSLQQVFSGFIELPSHLGGDGQRAYSSIEAALENNFCIGFVMPFPCSESSDNCQEIDFLLTTGIRTLNGFKDLLFTSSLRGESCRSEDRKLELSR